MKLNNVNIVRLYAVTECPDENGLHKLIPFETEEFNQVFDEKCLDDKLDDLCKSIYGDGEHFEVYNRQGAGYSCHCIWDGIGKIYLKLVDDKDKGSIIIPCIAGQFPRDRRVVYHIMVDRQFQRYCWVAVVWEDKIYLDSDIEYPESILQQVADHNEEYANCKL